MRTEIEYIGTESEKLSNALADAKAYLGKNYEPFVWEATCYIVTRWLPYKWFEFQAAFAGIEGLPARALWYEVLNRAERIIGLDN